MKPKIKSSERVNRRHLLLKTKNKNKVEKIILDYVGIIGWARASPIIKEYERGIVLSIDRGQINDIRAAFEICKEKIEIIKVSGTLKGLGIKRNI